MLLWVKCESEKKSIEIRFAKACKMDKNFQKRKRIEVKLNRKIDGNG